MSTVTPQRATIDDVMKVEGKAELVGGKVVRLMASGDLPGLAARNILLSLTIYSRSTGRGIVRGDNVGYEVPILTSGRQSFSPDASYFLGSYSPNRMRFLRGAPTFAVEVRSEHDYTPAADREYEAKRADYFEAGTLCVWDVDPHAGTVAKYLSTGPVRPTLYRLADVADAEPALPGWSMKVDDIFRE